MPQPQGQESVEMSFDEIKDVIRTEARNAVGETVAEQLTEAMERARKDWEKQSGVERARNTVANFKAALFGGGVGAADVQGLNEKRFGTEGELFNGMKTASLLFALAKGRHSRDEAISFAKGHENFGEPIVRALESSTFESGGSLIPEEYAADFIGYLYNSSVCRRLGATILEMPRGGINIGKQNGAATAYWVGEGGRIQVSQPTTGSLKLSEKKLGIIVPISNDLLANAPAGVENMVRNDMNNVARVAQDTAFLRGSGTEHQPKGIINSLAAGNTFSANGTFNVENVTADLFKAVYKVDGSTFQREMLRPGWAMNPRTIYRLMSLRTDDGFYVFMDELARGTLLGYQVGKTGSIPKNLGAGSNQTQIIFGDWSELIIGESLSAEISDSRDASFVDENGNTVHGFTDETTLTKLTTKVDSAVKRNTGFSVIDEVAWGASLDS